METVIDENALYKEYYNRHLPLIKSVLKKYYYLLDEHDLSSAGMNALLRCMRKYDVNRNVKFTTLLVNYINWECGVILKQRHKCKDQTVKDLGDKITTTSLINITDFFNDVGSILTDLEKNMLQDRYIHRLTLKEMSEQYRISKETIRKRIIKIRQKLTELYNVDGIH